MIRLLAAVARALRDTWRRRRLYRALRKQPAAIVVPLRSTGTTPKNHRRHH